MTKYILATLMITLLSNCGRAPVASITTPLGTNPCEVRDSCTYSDVPGYACQSTTWYPGIAINFVKPNAAWFNGSSCVITKEDYSYDSGCDPTNPTQMCSMGSWGGGPSQSYPCCQLVQGPGSSSLL